MTLRQVAQVAKQSSALDLGLSDACSVMECDGLVVEVSSMCDLPWQRSASAEDVRSVIREKMATLQLTVWFLTSSVDSHEFLQRAELSSLVLRFRLILRFNNNSPASSEMPLIWVD